jgi:hypothetical protein
LLALKINFFSKEITHLLQCTHIDRFVVAVVKRTPQTGTQQQRMLRLLLCPASYVTFNENCVKQFLLHRFGVNARVCGRIALRMTIGLTQSALIVFPDFDYFNASLCTQLSAIRHVCLMRAIFNAEVDASSKFHRTFGRFTGQLGRHCESAVTAGFHPSNHPTIHRHAISRVA